MDAITPKRLMRDLGGMDLVFPFTSSDAAATTAFLARTSGLDATHTNAYKALINGLVADGVFSKLDFLYTLGTQDSTNALLNLCSTSFNAVVVGSPTFTADRGFLGVDASATVYLDSQFNPSTAGGSFATNSAHISAWSNTNAASSASGGTIIGNSTSSGNSNSSSILPKYSDGNAYFRINDGTSSAGFVNANSTGQYIANRSGASATQGYRNASLVGSPNAAAGTLANKTIGILVDNDTVSGPFFGGAFEIAAASAGGSLSSTDVTNFYNRLRTFGTTLGWP